MKQLTEEEAIKALHDLADRWPATLWLFAASSSLHVMKTGPDGRRAVTHTGGMDPDSSLATIAIPSDGGDW